MDSTTSGEMERAAKRQKKVDDDRQLVLGYVRNDGRMLKYESDERVVYTLARL